MTLLGSLAMILLICYPYIQEATMTDQQSIRDARKWLSSLVDSAVRERGIDRATIVYTLLSRGTRYLRMASELKLDETFLCWTEETLRDIRGKLGVNNVALADLLLTEGTRQYMALVCENFKALVDGKINQAPITGADKVKPTDK